MVAADVQDGVTSIDTANRIYGVVVDGDGELDAVATETRRAQIRAERLSRGRPFSEFTAEWSQRRPPEEALKYYGDFPVPNQAIDDREFPDPRLGAE